MISNVKQLFAELLKATELRKVDFKGEQYRLDNDHFKSLFVKDILCMANAPGDDAYILLGVKSEKGKPRKIVGFPTHQDSSDLEAIANSIIEEPIQFEYYPLTYQGKECAVLYIPPSRAKPHWPKKIYGVLKKHVFYTRRASGNREASIAEIREMFLTTIRISDIAPRKAKSSPHVLDEMGDMDLADREIAMHKMLKSIAPKIGLRNYRSVYSVTATRHICSLVSSVRNNAIRNYAVFMYPWTVKRDDIVATRYHARNLIVGSRDKKARPSLRTRLRESTLIHVSYSNIYTKALESRSYAPTQYWFANEWIESWGRVIKWEKDVIQPMRGDKITYLKETKYEFFLANVTSKAELKDRLEKLLAWADSNIK